MKLCMNTSTFLSFWLMMHEKVLKLRSSTVADTILPLMLFIIILLIGIVDRSLPQCLGYAFILFGVVWIVYYVNNLFILLCIM